MSRDKSARKHVKSTLNKAAFKKYSSELLVTGGKDAAKVAAYHALGIVMRELVQGVFLEVKHVVNNWGKCKPAEIYRRFKDRVAALCEKIKSEWKDLLGGSLWSGVQAFLSNIVVFLINLFATTLKKLVSMIRAGFVSLTEAVKILVNPPAGMPREEVAYQALKILTAGLIGAMSMGLSAGIEQLLNSIPGLQPLMLFVVPIANRTVSDILSVTLSALVGGVMSTVALYYMDKVFMTEKKARLSLCLAVQSGTVAQYQVISSWNCLGKAFVVIGSQAEDAGDHLMDARKERAEEKDADGKIVKVSEQSERFIRSVIEIAKSVVATQTELQHDVALVRDELEESFQLKIDENTTAILANSEKNVEQDKELARQRGKDEEHDMELARQRRKDMEHDRALAEIYDRLKRGDCGRVPAWLKAVVLLNLVLSAVAIWAILFR